jgi:DNA-binding winged helix-turn-helix (wHTH) protein
MRTSNSIQTSDRVDAAFIGFDLRTSKPKSASVHLLSSSTKVRRITPTLRNEMAEFLKDIDGLPTLVRILIKDISADLQSDFVSCDIHSLLLGTLEKMVDRMRGLPLRRDASSEQSLAMVELISTEDSLGRSPALTNDAMLRVGQLELDLLDRTAKRGDRKIDLRPREFQLLKYMMQRSDNLLTRATLLKEVWRYRFVPETNLVDVHMGRLRRKVDASGDPPMIRNVRGLGFILNATPHTLNAPSKPAQRSGNSAAARQFSGSAESAAS